MKGGSGLRMDFSRNALLGGKGPDLEPNVWGRPWSFGLRGDYWKAFLPTGLHVCVDPSARRGSLCWLGYAMVWLLVRRRGLRDISRVMGRGWWLFSRETHLSRLGSCSDDCVWRFFPVFLEYWFGFMGNFLTRRCGAVSVWRVKFICRDGDQHFSSIRVNCTSRVNNFC